MKDTQGFLVVLKFPPTHGIPSREHYRGVDRLPHYSLFDQGDPEVETQAMDIYVFGDVRDEDTGLIPSYESAAQLLGMFETASREVELIYCRRLLESGANETATYYSPSQRLGVDVAGLSGDCWSIVADLPDVEEIAHFRKMLNKNGLFESATDARAYLGEYRRLKLHDFDIPFDVVEVRLCEHQNQPQ